jgi:hypothetical protein
MSWLRSKLSVCLLAFSLAVISTPGCGGIASFLLKLLFQVGAQAAASSVGKFIEEKLDSWIFNKNANENHGGDVIVTSSDGLSGKYNGKMEITVTGEGAKKSTVTLKEPSMIRDSKSSSWKLDPSIIKIAKQMTEDQFGK